MKYAAATKKSRRRWPIALVCIMLALALLGVAVTKAYDWSLDPVDVQSERVIDFKVETGSTIDVIARQLKEAGLIRSVWGFKLYIANQQAGSALQAGTYTLSPAQNVPAIASYLTGGQVYANTITILPGRRIDQIREMLLDNGFTAQEVKDGLNPALYIDRYRVFAGKPSRASLEGYLYPETFQITADTSVQDVVNSSLAELEKRLTTEIRQAFVGQGLTLFEAITLASIVEQEASSQVDRDRVAQVYLKRHKEGMRLEADPTAFYGSIVAGAEQSLRYDSPYNTYLHDGLPVGPISNVSESSLRAVAFPADTDWLYFVAGDDGTTYFSRTLEEHQRNTQLYCTKLCQ